MSEQLEYIIRLQEVFSLRMTDIGYLLDISRDTIYYCLDDKKISKSMLLSLKKLVEVAELFEREHIDRLDKFLDRPLANTPKLIDYLKDVVDKGFIDKKKTKKVINVIKTISEREKENRAKPKGSGNNLRSLADVSDEFSTNVYVEDISNGNN